MRVAIRVDARPLIGGGHAMRCLALADELANHGAEVQFVAAQMPEGLRDRIVAGRHSLMHIPPSTGMDRPPAADWHLPPLSEDAQLSDAAATEAAAGPVDWLVVDHYLLGRPWHSRVRQFAAKLLVIDDLANRETDCDILVDQTLGRAAGDYARLVPHEAKVLAGSTYALLRREFAAERQNALARRREFGAMRRILVSMGTTDPQSVSAEVVRRVTAEMPEVAVDVVLGPQAQSAPAMAKLARYDSNVTVQLDSTRMARLMRDSDLTIGASGTMNWERACLGLPAIVLILADNQRPGAVALSNAGGGIAIESLDELGSALRSLGDPEQRARMSAAAFGITDGRGCERVVAAMNGQDRPRLKTVSLRPATKEDSERLWLWRNDPLTRSQSREQGPITWDGHVRWLSSVLSSPERTIMIAERDGSPVGVVGLHALGAGGSEISINVAPESRGDGVGGAMLRAACADGRGRDIHAAVRAGNDKSRRLFESCGFHLTDSDEPGFLRYVRPHGDRQRKRA